jgi:hypothetical protein
MINELRTTFKEAIQTLEIHSSKRRQNEMSVLRYFLGLYNQEVILRISYKN